MEQMKLSTLDAEVAKSVRRKSLSSVFIVNIMNRMARLSVVCLPTPSIR